MRGGSGMGGGERPLMARLGASNMFAACDTQWTVTFCSYGFYTEAGVRSDKVLARANK